MNKMLWLSIAILGATNLFTVWQLTEQHNLRLEEENKVSACVDEYSKMFQESIYLKAVLNICLDELSSCLQ